MTPRARSLAALAATVLVAACSGTEPVGYDFVKSEGEGELGIWVHSGLYNRLYELHTPPGMSASRRWPLIVFLHGAGDTGPSFRRRLKADAATDAAGFVTVWPSGMEGTWTVGCATECTMAEALRADDVRFVQTLVRHLAAQLPVDTTRVYLLGFSQGGSFAQLFACSSEMAPAGLGVVGALLYKPVAQKCTPRRPFPVGVVHGDADPIALYGGYGPTAAVMGAEETVDLWRRQMGCGVDPGYEFIPDGAGDYTEVSVFRFPGCRAGSTVVHYLVHGGGHTWPGDTGPWSPLGGARSRNLDATGEFLKLFAAVAS
jgi:polyhydroxybutyrate depolymerase